MFNLRVQVAGEEARTEVAGGGGGRSGGERLEGLNKMREG